MFIEPIDELADEIAEYDSAGAGHVVGAGTVLRTSKTSSSQKRGGHHLGEWQPRGTAEREFGGTEPAAVFSNPPLGNSFPNWTDWLQSVSSQKTHGQRGKPDQDRREHCRCRVGNQNKSHNAPKGCRAEHKHHCPDSPSSRCTGRSGVGLIAPCFVKYVWITHRLSF